MVPSETDVGRALRAMARWRLAVALAIVGVAALCLAAFGALALLDDLRGPVPLPTRTPLLP